MFIPNRIAHIRRKSQSADMYGQYTYGQKEAIHYGLVRYDTKIEDSTVRADSSATRGNIKEYHASGRILVHKKHKPNFGDLVVVEGRVFQIRGVEPRFNVLGKLDHYQCELEKYEDLYGDEK
jgi:hypothetical protein